jgi:Zn finger protein HypA/HybF involved in hydrogenase expression
MTPFPVSRHCLYCKELIHIVDPVEQVECPWCHHVMKVVEGRTIRLSKITSESNSNGGHSEWQ